MDLHTRLNQDILLYNEAVDKHDSVQIAYASYEIAKRHINLANYGLAEAWLLKALAIRKKFNHFEHIGKIFIRRSEISLILERPIQTIRYAQLAMLYLRKSNSQKGIMSGHEVLGQAYLLTWEKEGKSSTTRHRSKLFWATRHFEEALKLSQMLSIRIDEAIAYRYLGICARHRNDISQSLSLKIKAWDIHKEEGLLPNAIELAIDIAYQYLDLQNLEKGSQWLGKAENLKGERKLKPGIIMNLLDVQAKYFEQTGQWKEALACRSELEVIRDEAYLQYRNEAIDGVRKSEEAKLKGATLLAQKKELALLKSNASLKTQILSVIGLLLLICAVAAILYSRLYTKYKTLSQYNAGLVKEQSHRTQNDLQAVSTLLSLHSHQLQDPIAAKLLEESLLRVESIILIHRRLYQGTMPMFVDVEPYLDDLTQSILKVYHKWNVELSFDIPPFALHVKKMASLALVVNELITNACKYALDSDFPKLTMSCRLESGQIKFLFADNGPGFKRENVKTGFGLGLIDMLCQQLDGSYTFRQEKGCQFSISFPITADLISLSSSPKTTPVFS